MNQDLIDQGVDPDEDYLIYRCRRCGHEAAYRDEAHGGKPYICDMPDEFMVGHVCGGVMELKS